MRKASGKRDDFTKREEEVWHFILSLVLGDKEMTLENEPLLWNYIFHFATKIVDSHTRENVVAGKHL